MPASTARSHRTPTVPHRSRRQRWLAVLLVCALLVVLPFAPTSEAQGDDSLPSPAEQQQAAKDLLAQLDEVDGPVDPSTISIDPALGPPPWTSFIPGRDQSTVDAWTTLASRISGTKAGATPQARGALPNAVNAIADIETPNETGLNDSVATGQLVAGFGTGSGEDGFARVTGVLGAPPPPPPEPDCPSVEDDSSIPQANATALALPEPSVLLCGGTIGDGEFGATSGDVDFFALNTVEAGTLITIDAGSFDPAAVFSVATAVYSADGTLVGTINDSDSGPDSILAVIAPTSGDYYAAVAGADGLLSDPFDPATGPGATYVGEYLFFATLSPAPPPPCQSIEPDSTIPEANALPFGPGVVAPCFGLIGDGEFGASTGDFDFFRIEVDTMSDIIVDIVPTPGLASTPLTIAVFNDAGTLIASLDDDGVNPSDFLAIGVEQPGVYYALVSSPGVLPSDPFDASSGTVAGPETPYTVFAVSFPLLGPPPIPPQPTPTPTPPGGPDEPVPAPTPVPTPGGPDEPDPAPPGPVPLPYGAAYAPEQAHEMVAAAPSTWAELLDPVQASAFQMLAGPCASLEDDGSILQAVAVEVVRPESVECAGEIGDGPFGISSGDFDIYAVAAVAGEALVADIDAEAFGLLDAFVRVYDDLGNVVAENDDFDGLDSRVEFPVPQDGTYFVAVSGFASFLADPFDSSSGTGATSAGPYLLTLARTDYVAPDVDVFLVDLDVGDALSAGFNMTGTITVVDPAGQVGIASGGSAAVIYPQTSPLRHIGNVGVDYVADTAGTHAIVLANGPGVYLGELRVKRSGLTDTPGDDAQILFLDFDGGQFNQAIFDPFQPDNSGPIRTLSPLASFLPRWGLDPSDENALIDAIVAEVAENALQDLHEVGGNGNRDATGIGGEMDLEIRNSRDHADPWGEPNVSRIIIGGTITEAGIGTIGIAQSIDPGNFERSETAIVLLDLLSDPAGIGSPSLNDFGFAAPLTQIDLVARGLGLITAHEAGHFIGNWHTASFNGVASIMDEGGDLPGLLGVGPDFVLGTADDADTDFAIDEFSIFEGFSGIENTAARSAHGLSTGQTNVDVVGDLPAEGVYYLRNVGNGRVLDADSNGDVDTSSSPSSDDEWELINIGGDVFNLRSVEHDTYLDGDADGTVDQSQSPSSDDRWQLLPVGDGSFELFNLDRSRYLSGANGDAELSSNRGDTERWIFDAVGDPVDPDPVDPDNLVGQDIALQSVATGRWLDTDSNGNVDQSVVRRADDVWRVADAGDGMVYLINRVTHRYLDADAGDNNVETSIAPSADDRWQIIDLGDSFALRNVQYGGYLHAEGSAANYNTVTEPELSQATQWTIEVISTTP